MNYLENIPDKLHPVRWRLGWREGENGNNYLKDAIPAVRAACM